MPQFLTRFPRDCDFTQLRWLVQIFIQGVIKRLPRGPGGVARGSTFGHFLAARVCLFNVCPGVGADKLPSRKWPAPTMGTKVREWTLSQGKLIVKYYEISCIIRKTEPTIRKWHDFIRRTTAPAAGSYYPIERGFFWFNCVVTRLLLVSAQTQPETTNQPC